MCEIQKTYRRGAGRILNAKGLVQIFKFRERKKFKIVFCELESREPEKEKKKNFKSEKRKNWVYFQMYDAVKCQMMPFKPIFSPVERFKHENGVVVSLCLRKRLRTLKNGFCCFYALKYPNKHAKTVLFCYFCRH